MVHCFMFFKPMQLYITSLSQCVCPIAVGERVANNYEQCVSDHSSLPQMLQDLFIECFTTTFLRAHSWLNWVQMLQERYCAKTLIAGTFLFNFANDSNSTNLFW